MVRKITWEEVEVAANSLASVIKTSDFNPDYIVGLATGGLIPLYFLSKKIGISNVLIVSSKLMEKDNKKEIKITYLPDINLKNKKLLLVDEISSTGFTLKTVAEIIVKKYEPSEIKTATLATNKNKCQKLPDFYVLSEDDEKIVFPWEKEDFSKHFNLD